MQLRGWDYTGRNIGPELHRQFRIMIENLSDPSFTNHSSWGNPIQDKLASSMKIGSSGAVRTVKRVCVNFGFLVEESFSSRNEIAVNNLLTERGQLVYHAAKLEQEVNDSSEYNGERKKRILAEIKKLYEEAYCNALKTYYFKNDDNSRLHPLRATLKALAKYKRLDKWEWYLLNTYIRHDDDSDEEQTLDKYIKMYRNRDLSFSMADVIEKPKGHQYTPQHFEFAGLLHVIQRPEWSISDSGRHMDIKNEVLKDDFLVKLYRGDYK